MDKLETYLTATPECLLESHLDHGFIEGLYTTELRTRFIPLDHLADGTIRKQVIKSLREWTR